MPRPQSIVAVILAIAVVLGFAIGATLRILGHDIPPEVVEMWLALMGTLVGGLIAYIGTGRNKDE